MHKLDRTRVVAPVCLGNYEYPKDTWTDVIQEDKKEIQNALIAIQGNLCAYCESAVFNDAHIEHFRRKDQQHFPELTFEWTNLFRSCQALKHCGHYKDRRSAPSYNPDHLVKPDVDDPDTYFYFHSSGQARVRQGIDEEVQMRADETIRVLNLNSPDLQYARRRAIKAYERARPGILEALMDFDEEERRLFIDEEIRATAQDPFCTTIRHFFEKNR